ncbi:hypothetical protein P3S67_015487 [Capsicum chacoense]
MNLTNLDVLNLAYNNFSREVPHSMGSLTNLSCSYIGDLLVQWKNQESENRNPLLYLKTIDLSSNELVGGIPEEIAEMRGLKSLNLSRNDLNGTLIVGIGQMKIVLDLSNNHLSRRIPSSTQLQSFDRSSYSGNAQLGGPPLQECPGYAPPSPHIDHGNNSNPQEHHDDDEDFPSLEFYISMVLGFSIVFWGFWGCLIVNRSWRNAYFTFLTDMKSWLHMTSRVCSARLKEKLRA